jgi:hypothetical protein
MKRVAGAFAVAAILGLAGYWLAGRWDEQTVWEGDRLVSVPQPPPDPKSSVGRSAADAGIRFTDVAADLGMLFTYYHGAEGKFYLMETTGGGMAVLDYDGDGMVDIFFVNGSRLPFDASDRRFVASLFRNRALDVADNVAPVAGTELAAFGQGAASSDFDNDGFADLYVTGYRSSVLYQNHGDGTFGEVSASAGVQSNLWGTSAAFADLDQDGAMDLYVCTYSEVSVSASDPSIPSGRGLYRLPGLFPAQPDLLLHNRGDGTFEEVSRTSGVMDESGRGLGIAIADFDGDDRPDIFVANDTSENFLFINEGQLQFEESALRLGVALTATGATMSGMGVACGDFDRNGWTDLSVTNFYHERSVLYQNLGAAGFLDSADATGVGIASRDRLGFGTVFIDANLDGFPDLFVANGHINDQSEMGIPYRMRAQLLINERGSRFRDASDSAGPYFTRRVLGRGVASLDYNNDGLPDIVVSHLIDPVSLLVNQTPVTGHWLGLRLTGSVSNRDGINAKVTIQVDGEQRAYEFVSGGGYLSSSDKRLIIGLGDANAIDAATVRWPSGKEMRLGELKTNRYYDVRER